MKFKFKAPWFFSRRDLIINATIDSILYCLFFSGLLGSNNEYNYFQVFLKSFSTFLIWLLFSYVVGRYHFESDKTIPFIAKDILLISSFFLFLYTISISFNVFDLLKYSDLSIDKLILFSLLTISLRLLFRIFYLRTSSNIYPWIFLGNKKTFDKLLKELPTNHKSNFINILHLDIANIKTMNHLSGIILENKEELNPKDLKYMLELKNKGVKVIRMIDWLDNFLERLPTILFINNESAFINLKNSKRLGIDMRLKRLGDITLSLFLILITLPLTVLAILFIYIEDQGNIFYSQKRCGLSGEIFKITKLRTMYLNAEDKGSMWSQRNDPRVTKVGRILRRTRIDELPQLISVIKGDMSLIGPRPERPEFDRDLIEKIPLYQMRYSMRPGLSGWAQVNFPYGASIEDAKIKLSYDIYYLRNFSFWIDILILFKTIRLVFNAKGSEPKIK